LFVVGVVLVLVIEAEIEDEEEDEDGKGNPVEKLSCVSCVSWLIIVCAV
jgi:hypothetical protein